MTKAKKNKMRMPQTINAFGVSINKCCASCAFKDLTRAVSLRRCKVTGEEVTSSHTCGHWVMSEQLELAGRSQGAVKRREYLMSLVAEREDERLAEQLGLKIRPKSIAQIRAEFEREHGSIYMEI